MTAEWTWAPLDTGERRALRESVGALAAALWGPAELADHPPEVVEQLRDRLTELGVPMLLVPEPVGVGGDLADAAALATEVGARLLPFSTADLVLHAEDRHAAAMLDLFEMAGALGALVEATARYLGLRVQFGRRLLEFQVLQHRLADLSLRHFTIETAAIGALRWLDSPSRDGAVDPRGVHELVRTTYQDAVEDALQLHGAIGFTWEAGFHRYLDHAMGMAGRLAGVQDGTRLSAHPRDPARTPRSPAARP